MEITFSFLFQQLCPFKGKLAQGRMNARFTEHFPSAVHEDPHPPPGQSTASTRLGDLRHWTASLLWGSPPGLWKSQARHAEVVRQENTFCTFQRRKPGT